MLKSIIAPIQSWLLAKGQCVGCGRTLGKDAKLLANVDASLSMTKSKRPTAARSLVRYSLLALLIAGSISTSSHSLFQQCHSVEFEIKRAKALNLLHLSLIRKLLRSPFFSSDRPPKQTHYSGWYLSTFAFSATQ